MPSLSRKWVIAAAVVIGLAVIGGIVKALLPSEENRLETLRVVEVTRSPFYAPQYVALSKGFFEEEGLDIQLSNGFGGDKTMTALLSGDADIVLVGVEAAVYVNARGASSPVTAFAQLTQTDGSFLVSREPMENFRWSDLRGKALLGQRKGGMPQMVSEYVQRKNGLNPHKDVKIIQNVDYKNLGSAFASGTGDFAQLFEPTASMLEKEGKGYVVASFGVDSGKLPYTAYITRAQFIEERPEVIRRFVRALHRAQKWTHEHSPEEISDAISPYFTDTDPEVLIRVVKRYQSQESWAPDPIIERPEYEHLLEVMRQAGELPSNIPYEKIVRTDIAEAVMEELD